SRYKGCLLIVSSCLILSVVEFAKLIEFDIAKSDVIVPVVKSVRSLIASVTGLTLSSIPSARPIGNHLPTSSAITLDGEAIPKNFLIPPVTEDTNPLILFNNQFFTELIPAHKPFTISTPIDLN